MGSMIAQQGFALLIKRLATIKPFAKKKSIKLYSVRCLDDPEIEKYDAILNDFEQVDLVDVDLKPMTTLVKVHIRFHRTSKGVVATHRGAITAFLMANG